MLTRKIQGSLGRPATLIFLAVLSLGLAAGCKPKQQAAPPAQTPEVTTVEVKSKELVLTTELPGRTAPFLIAEIRPQVNGLIQKRLFEEGSIVKAGQELYQIDPAPFQAALDNARAALGRAEANLPAIQVRVDRYKDALADKAVSQQDYDDAAAALKQAQAEVKYYQAMVETARINLNYARVVSPITGRVGMSTVTDGAIVTAYQPTPLSTVQQLDPIYVDVPQSATELLSLRRRLEQGVIKQSQDSPNAVKLILPDGKEYSREGTLQFRDISVDPTTGSVILRMVFPNPDGVLLPGMFVRAQVKEGMDSEAITIPQQAVSRDPKGRPVALVLEDGKVDQRILTVDRAIKDQWLVTSGLKVGDRVIVEGSQKVRPGAPAKEAAPAGAAPAPAPGSAQPLTQTNSSK
jgi:membrane fusion protein (multidrug efflux system)